MSIGFIDSGIGGLTTLCECKKAFPKANFIYIADTQNAPYGIKSKEFLLRRSYELVEELVNKGVKAVVFACNSCSVSTSYKHYGQVPIFRLVPDVDKALSETQGKVLLMATPVTIANLPCDIKEKNRLMMLADKTLATKVETSLPNFSTLTGYMERILTPYKEAEAIILGCTHYLYLSDVIGSIFPNVKLYHSNNQAIRSIKALNIPEENGGFEIIFTGEKNCFYEQLVHKLMISH